MGLDVTKARNLLQEIRDQHKYNQEILDRNQIVLPDSHVIKFSFQELNTDILYRPGMVTFEYQNWRRDKFSLTGHVIEVKLLLNVFKINLWTANNEAAEIELHEGQRWQWFDAVPKVVDNNEQPF